ncbi:MAG TPA: 50S ribosomal protein L21 [bacterium]|jgi:large subunit ribosomal protein L21|nr:50S ribosomal protein L21 [bacterium]HOG38064.1 50S ribosomal protein L21 [bacterium]HQI03120.1 50S ribosomal protein L21 [bacterium]
MKLAVVRTGGKQYKVKEGDKIKVEKIEGDEGSKIELDDILLLVDDDKVEIGTPKLDKKITATILKQSRAKKVRVVKYKAKTRYHKVYGHRQHFTELAINKI